MMNKSLLFLPPLLPKLPNPLPNLRIVSLKQFLTYQPIQYLSRNSFHNFVSHKVFALPLIPRHPAYLLDMSKLRPPENPYLLLHLHLRIPMSLPDHIKVHPSIQPFHRDNPPVLRHMLLNVHGMGRPCHHIIPIKKPVVILHLALQPRIGIRITLNLNPGKLSRKHHDNIRPGSPHLLLLNHPDLAVPLFQIIKQRLPDIFVIQHQNSPRLSFFRKKEVPGASPTPLFYN